MGTRRDRDDDAPASATPETRPDGIDRGVNVTVSNADESYADLDAPASEDGSMAQLLGKVASAPSAAPPIELAAGSLVDGTFRVIRPLGQGGMGVVYLARDLDLQRDVALKVHRASHGLDRLQREAVAMAQLAHPNVLTVHAVGQVNARLYIAMEYVPGSTLRAWLGEQREPGGVGATAASPLGRGRSPRGMDASPRTWRDIVTLMRAAGEGLAAAHDAGFVHRDFKPENVLVGRDGRPRVGDFGLVRVAADLIPQSGVLQSDPGASQPLQLPPDQPASALAETIDVGSGDAGPRRGSAGATPSSGSANLTATGAALGTPAYMAPEQFIGGPVDARADQFAFCVVLHEALAGKRPFPGATYAELRDRVTARDPEPLPRGKAPTWLARAIRRGLARDPADRWPDMRALIAALHPPRGRWILPIAGASLAVVAATALAWRATREPATTDAAVCDAAGAEIDAIATPARRAAVRARFASVDPTIGPELVSRADRGVDAWLATYRDVAQRACKASAIDRAWSARTTAASALCLRRGQEALDRSLGRAERAERDAMPAASGELRSPFPLDECLDERVLLSDYQTPADPVAAERVDDLIDRVFDLEDLVDAGRLDEARAGVAALQPEVAREAYPTLTVRALELEAQLARAERKLDVAVERHEQAYSAATAAGLEALALSAARGLIWVHGVDRGDVAAARPWIVQALPEAERYGLRHRVASAVYYAAAVVAEIDADYDRAIELHRQRVAALEGGDELELGMALGGLGTTLDASGSSEEALVAYGQALAAIERVYGAEHPKTVWLRSNIVIAQIAVGDVAGGVATAERGVALLARTPGVEPIEAANLRFNYAFALQRAERNAEAKAVYAELRPAFVALSGEDSIDVAYVDANLGILHRIDKEYEAARVRLGHALEVRKSMFGEDHDEVADVYTHLGDVEAEDGAHAKAVVWFRKAIAVFRAVADRTGVVFDRVAAPLLGLGHSLEQLGDRDGAIAAYTEAQTRAAQGHDAGVQQSAAWKLGWALAAAGRPAEARATLVDARARIVDTDAAADADRAKIDRWLAKH